MSNAAQIFGLVDLTSLGDDDTDQSIKNLCQKATGPLGSVAAVCVNPQFAALAREHLPNSIAVATVVNFPKGNAPAKTVWENTAMALDEGADEIDLVIPYTDYIAGHRDSTILLVQNAKALCGTHSLKVILETGELKDPDLIFQASEDVLFAGADFVKTSTGKVPTGVTPEAVEAICQALKSFKAATGEKRGIKISGGIRTKADASAYLTQVLNALGESYGCKHYLRIGASSLIDAL